MTILSVKAELPCRLDRYLKRIYPSFTQGRLERALRLKQILVNSGKSVANLRVKLGDQIFIDNNLKLEPKTTSSKVFAREVVILSGNLLKDYLVYQDDHFIAINKPAGLATQGGSKINLSVDEALQYLNSQGADFKLVHRLDKNTSGILLIAKNYISSIKLVKGFKDRLIQKTYIAVVSGTLPQREGEISSMIGKEGEGPYNAKLAITRYKSLDNFSDNRYLSKLAYAQGYEGNTERRTASSTESVREDLSLGSTHKLPAEVEFPKISNLTMVEFMPLTGRIHQLRVHAKMLDCPIIGDRKYGTSAAIALSNKMLLHAKRILLAEEIFGKEIEIDIALPSYFNLL